MDPWVEKQERKEMKKMKKHCDMLQPKNDGLHFRQPWVLGVQEEVRSFRQEVDEMAAEIAQLKELFTRK
ncbi:hypothetical protein DY000_02030504 [Brassica cretica]|uniref:Uncharacterized protein n=1 Tax=Brassica cretica TaxID=69181 RepID=A0ABQ7DGB6_BRACR|nr:hypothetical protein DY000_02030504 [Brassica cretica]